MQAKYLNLIIITFLILACSCKPLKNHSPSKNLLDTVAKENFTALNGVYKNKQDTVFGKIRHSPHHSIADNNESLIDRLFVLVPDKRGFYETTLVDIEFISKGKARIKAYRNDTLVFSKNLKGKFKDGYFYVNPRVYIIPFFPLYYVHNFERVRIAQYNGNLIVDHTKMLWGFAFMGGGSEYGSSTSIYSMSDK